MADRRMFTKKITDSDAFTALPPSTQALYFHLCMGADDDGFSNKLRTAMFNAHADQNDLGLLVQNRFVIPFDNGVIVIKHWKMHNVIRADRYHETEYLEEKSTLLLKDNGVYTEGFSLSDNQVTTNWQPNDNQMETEVRLGKDSIGKDRLGKARKGKTAAPVFYPNDEKLNEAFTDYVDMRKKIKAPMTDKAITLAINKLDKLSNGDNDTAIAILNQSVMNSWKGLFELKTSRSQQQGSLIDAMKDW
jgi:hypothetical protein